jgi:hypothetical protein
MTALTPRAFVARETVVGIMINMVLSAIVYVTVFRGAGQMVPVWGRGGLALDCVPQCIAVSFMSSLVPGWLAQRALRDGRVVACPKPWRLSPLFAVRCAIGTVGGAMLGITVGLMSLRLLNVALVEWHAALWGKIAFGGALGGIIIVLTLPDALRPHGRQL